MIFTKSARDGCSFPFSGQEIAALRKRRLILISEIASLADQIAGIDNRLTYLRDYGEMDRPGTAIETTSEASTKSEKKVGEAEAWDE